MPSPIRVSRAIVGIQAESTPYTFLEPDAAHCFHAVNIQFSPTAQQFERKDTRSHFGIIDAIPGAAEADVSFEIPLVGGASLGAVPFLDTAIMACGHMRGQLKTSGTAHTGASMGVTAGTIYTAGGNMWICTVTGTASIAPAQSSGGVSPTDYTYNSITKTFTDRVGGVQTPQYRFLYATPTGQFIPTAWDTNTGLGRAFAVGNIVQGIGTRGANNLYYCVVAGTGATSGADFPALTAGLYDTSIVDGTARWQFLCASSGNTSTAYFYRPTTQFDASYFGSSPFMYTCPSESYSVSIWDETGTEYAIKGAQGNMSFSTKQGEPLIMKFKFHGAFVPVTDDVVPVITDSSLIPPTCMGATLSVFGNPTLAFDGYDFDKGNALSKRGDISQVSGVRGAWITAHKPMIKISPEMVTVANQQFFTDWRSGNPGAFQQFLLGTAVGNRFYFLANRAQIRDAGLGEREGARTADLGLALTTYAADPQGTDYVLCIT